MWVIFAVRILLGLSPFAYDGVNQYAINHPETRAKNADGTPIGEGGIFTWGGNYYADQLPPSSCWLVPFPFPRCPPARPRCAACGWCAPASSHRTRSIGSFPAA